MKHIPNQINHYNIAIKVEHLMLSSNIDFGHDKHI